jgi:ferredoxin
MSDTVAQVGVARLAADLQTRRRVVMKPIVDRDLCIGCELCADTCPEVFVLDEDGLARVLVQSPGHDQYDCIREAEQICPVTAISVVSD